MVGIVEEPPGISIRECLPCVYHPSMPPAACGAKMPACRARAARGTRRVGPQASARAEGHRVRRAFYCASAPARLRRRLGGIHG